MTRSAKRKAATLVAVLGAGTLSACGVQTQDAPEPNQQQPSASGGGASVQSTNTDTLRRREARRLARRRAALPSPVTGQIVVAGPGDLGITQVVAGRFEGTSNVDVVRREVSSGAAFAALCAGRADIAESDRLPSEAEIRACEQNGISLLLDDFKRVRPIQLAAEAIVVATRNQSDVGGDCLRLNTVRDIFRSGSQITSWEQVGFDAIPLQTTGRDDDTGVFQLFGELLFSSSRAPRLGDFRQDYRVKRTDDSVRNEITGDLAVEEAARRARARLSLRLRRARVTRRRFVDAAIRRADRDFLAVLRRENAALKRSKRRLSDARAKALERRNRRRIEAAKDRAARVADAAFVQRIREEERRSFISEAEQLTAPGDVGFFRFTYYELYEEKLRPMEIWDPVTSQTQLELRGIATNRSHVQAEVQTDERVDQTGGLRLETTTTRTFKRTPTSPGATYVAGGGRRVTVPASGPQDVDRTPSCVFPSRRTITSGAYPLSTRLLAFSTTTRAQRREVRDYLGFYLGEGQRIVEEKRLIPLEDQVRADEFRRITGRELPQEQLEDASTANDDGSSTGTAGATTTDESTTTTTPSESADSTTSTTPEGQAGDERRDLEELAP